MLRDDILANMKHIVDNCMGEDVPACEATCPMHTDAKQYIKLIRDGKGYESMKVIRDTLFLPGTLGRICAHPCEATCKWNEGKSTMAIASLKRYAADNFDREEDWDLSVKPDNGKTVAIIGSGPAGLQAAIDLRREGFSVTIFEKLEVRGGMMQVGIPLYRLPRNVLDREINYLDMLGVKFVVGCEIGKDKPFSELLDEFDSVIIAVGKHKGRIDTSIKNSDAKRIFSAADYLREVSLTKNVEGVGKSVLVVGGGDVAMDCARTSLRLQGVETVYSVCLENSFETMASSPHEIRGAVAEGIKFNHGYAIKEIFVDNDKNITGVVLKKCIRTLDENGKFSPQYDENNIIKLDIDTIVFAIGQLVDGEFAKDFIAQSPNTTFECDRDTLQSPTNEKIFITGDASGESFVVVQAMATGRRAAESVKRFLMGKSLTANRDINDTCGYDTKLDMPTDWSKISGKRMDMQELDPAERIKSFDEVELGYTAEEAFKEADRCRQCECKLCMHECIMMNDYAECPKSLFREYLEKGIDNVDKMIAYSCNECDQCTLKCPKKFEIKDVFKDLKSEYAALNEGMVALDELKASEAAQVKECSEEYCTILTAKPKEKIVEEKKVEKVKTKYVFFPGCTVPAYTPDGVESVIKHLKSALGEENVGALLQCCGKVSGFLGENKKFEERNRKALDILDEMGAEVVITVCPSCFKIIKENSRNQRVIAYWDLVRNLIGLPEGAKGIGKGSDVVFNIHDSCVTREEISHHESVRWILDEMGYKWEEIEHNGVNTRCCGVGGMVCESNPDLYRRLYERRVSEMTQDHVLTYCGSCRTSMQKGGKDAVHILDLMFGPKYTKDQAQFRGYMNEIEMWETRLKTKAKIDAFK